LEEISRSHIVVDWISREDLTGIPGIYGKVSLEAMTLGRVAVSFIDPAIRPLYPKDLPVVSPSSCSPEDLAICLAELINDRSALQRMAARGPPYVQENHDPERIARWFIDEYQGLTK
jgi:glycosyltransferase involved in cell wall biosynthesis